MGKIQMFGQDNVGKRKLLKEFIQPNNVDLDFQIASILFDRQMIRLFVWQNQSDKRTNIQKVDGIVAVFDLSNVDSFEFVKQYLEAKGDKNERILIGNCFDTTKQRKVSKQSAHALADRCNTEYVEVNDANPDNIKQAFLLLIENMILAKEKRDKQKQSVNECAIM